MIKTKLNIFLFEIVYEKVTLSIYLLFEKNINQFIDLIVRIKIGCVCKYDRIVEDTYHMRMKFRNNSKSP